MFRAALTAVLLMGVCASAQTGVSPVLHTAPVDPTRFPLSFYQDVGQPALKEAPVTGAPYEARLTVTVSGTGDRVTSPTVEQTWMRSRDSAGRVRDQSLTKPRTLGGSGDAYQVHVNDPVAHCSISWEDPLPEGGHAIASFICDARVVSYGELPEPLWDQTTVPHDTKFGGREEHVQALPDEVVEGVRTTGVRSETSMRGNGSQSGTHETTTMRFGPELHVMVLIEREWFNDAGITIRTRTALTGIRLVEPDGALFYPPTGYERVDGNKPVTHP